MTNQPTKRPPGLMADAAAFLSTNPRQAVAFLAFGFVGILAGLGVPAATVVAGTFLGHRVALASQRPEASPQPERADAEFDGAGPSGWQVAMSDLEHDREAR